MDWMVLTPLCYSLCLGVLDEHLSCMCSAVMVPLVWAGLLGSCAEPGGKWPERHSLCLIAGKSHTTCVIHEEMSPWWRIVLLNWISYFCNSCAKKKPSKKLDTCGINFCEFSESTNKGYKSSLIFQNAEELNPECETPWCCSVLPKWPWAGQTAGLDMSKSATRHPKCWPTWTCFTSITVPVWTAVW